MVLQGSKRFSHCQKLVPENELFVFGLGWWPNVYLFHGRWLQCTRSIFLFFFELVVEGKPMDNPNKGLSNAVR